VAMAGWQLTGPSPLRVDHGHGRLPRSTAESLRDRKTKRNIVSRREGREARAPWPHVIFNISGRRSGNGIATRSLALESPADNRQGVAE